MNKPTSLKYFRLVKWSQNKVRTIKIIFKDSEEKKLFLSSLYKLKSAGKELKMVHVGHDLSLNMPLKKDQEKNESKNSPEFQYEVRGPPFALKIVKIPHKEAKK